MTSEADLRIQNLQSSILFMQQEHANTLKGLHEEIGKLQKRCKELTFQLAMETTSTPQEDVFREKCESLEKQTKEQSQNIKQMESVLESKDTAIKMLEKKLKAQENRFEEDLRAKMKIYSQMQSELESKANKIAILTTQMHSMRTNSLHNSNTVPGSEAEFRPTPPKGVAPKTRRRSSTGATSASLQGQVKNRPPSSRKLPAKPDTPEAIPDPTPFLSMSTELDQDRRDHLVTASERKPLPPIMSSTQHPPSEVDVLIPQSSSSYKFVRTTSMGIGAGKASPEVETLAVEQALHRDHSLRRAQEYKSTD